MARRFTMLADGRRAFEVVTKPGGPPPSLPEGRHPYLRRHDSVAAIQNVKKLHGDAGRFCCHANARTAGVGRVGSGRHTGRGTRRPIARCRPLFDTIPRRTFEAGPDPVAAAAIKDRQ